MRRSCRILASCVLLCGAMSACSGSSAPGDSSTGGAPQASGGAAGPGGGTGGASSSTGTGGAGVSVGSSGGATSPGTGGGAIVAGTGGTAPGGPGGRGGPGGITGSGGSSRDGGTSASSGGATGAGNTGGRPDQTALPALTVHLAGDSTMSNYAASTTQEGWGQEFGQYFISKVTIDNQALGGANIETFYTGRWKTLINNVKAGDFVFAAFGINDSGTTHGPVTPAAFQTRMGVMADEVAAKNATFIPTTSSPLQVWTGGKETNARLQPYCDVTIAVGTSKSLLVDDLNARGIEYYNMIGQTAAAALTFNGDKAHFDKAGATAMALLASKELARVNSPLAAYLK